MPVITHRELLVEGRKFSYKEMINDFRIYLILKWQWLQLPKPTVLQLEIAWWLQFKGDRQMIRGFRGIAKTWITASFAEWNWLRNRDYRVMIVSGNQKKADEISLFIKQSIDGFPVLSPLRWADWEKQHVRWGIQQFNIKGAPPDVAPSCKAISIGSMLTGSRAHLIIGDDIETLNNSATVESRDILMNQVGEFESILLPGGSVVLLGTPQSEESIYNVITSRGYATGIWPCRVPTEDQLPSYGTFLSDEIKQMVADGAFGQPTEPTRFPDEVLLQKEAGQTKASWRLQMMLDTTLSDQDRYPLKLKDLLVTGLDPIRAPLSIVHSGLEKYRVTDIQSCGFTGDFMVSPMFVSEDWRTMERKYLVVDPSGRGTDETAWVVFGTLGGRYYVLDIGGTTDGYGEETLELLTQKAIEFQVNEVVYEDNFGDGMFGVILGQHMKLKYPVAISPRKAKGQKELRILDVLEPVIRSHKLVVDHGAAQRDTLMEDKSYSLFYQMAHLTRERGCLRHDDRLDCLAHGIAHVQSVAGTNTQESYEAALRSDREKCIEDLIANSHMFDIRKGLPGANISQELLAKHSFTKSTQRFFFNKRS